MRRLQMTFFPPSNEETIAVEKFINKDLPDGFKYKPIEGVHESNSNDVRILSPINKWFDLVDFPITLWGYTIQNTEELLNLLYCLQKPLDGDELRELFKRDVVKSTTGNVGEQRLMPPPFPDLEPIRIELNNQSEIVLPIKRVVSDDINMVKLISSRDKIFYIDMLVNPEEQSMTYIFGVNQDVLRKLDDFFKFESILTSFFSNGVNVRNEELRLDFTVTSANQDMYAKRRKIFYALRKIQERYHLKFDYPKEITTAKVNKIKCLYESLINNRAVIVDVSSEIILEFENREDIDKQFIVGNKFGYYYVEPLTLSIFGVEIQLQIHRILPVVKIIKIEEDENHKIVVTLEHEGNPQAIEYWKIKDLNGNSFNFTEKYCSKQVQIVKLSEINFDK